MSRLPESRLLALRATATEAAERAFNRPSTRTELFSSAAALRGTRNRLISLQVGNAIPLKTKPIDEWPSKTEALCLHCAEACPSSPLPAVKYYDAHEEKFWVYGYFCRPCCSLAYVQEHPNTDTPRCIIWTQTVMRVYFGVSGAMSPAPPRAALKKFGGKLSLEQFYGDDGSSFKALHTPPFVTFAMYAELTNAGVPINSKDVSGLRRPEDNGGRVKAESESTEKTPLILEFLAKRGAIKPQNSQITSASTEPKKRKILAAPPPKMEETLGGGGGLARYIMKS